MLPVSTRWALTAPSTAPSCSRCPGIVCLIVATILGGIWGAIPGFFKAYFNINEVITSIMFNWIGLYLVNELIYQNGTGPMYDVRNTRTLNLGKSAELSKASSRTSA